MINIVDKYIVSFDDKQFFLEEDYDLYDEGSYYIAELEELKFLCIPKKGSFGFVYGFEVSDIKNTSNIDCKLNNRKDGEDIIKYIFEVCDNILGFTVETCKKEVDYKVDKFTKQEIFDIIKEEDMESSTFDISFEFKSIRMKYRDGEISIPNYKKKDDLLHYIMYFCENLEDN